MPESSAAGTSHVSSTLTTVTCLIRVATLRSVSFPAVPRGGGCVPTRFTGSCLLSSRWAAPPEPARVGRHIRMRATWRDRHRYPAPSLLWRTVGGMDYFRGSKLKLHRLQNTRGQNTHSRRTFVNAIIHSWTFIHTFINTSTDDKHARSCVLQRAPRLLRWCIFLTSPPRRRIASRWREVPVGHGGCLVKWASWVIDEPWS